ncbi:hypothetical protein DFO62_12353 [Serratia fonticola]|nr:hypothetical protein DFO62_12353 [Serratia fonticola]
MSGVITGGILIKRDLYSIFRNCSVCSKGTKKSLSPRMMSNLHCKIFTSYFW